MPQSAKPMAKISAYVKRLRTHAAETRTFLGNPLKPERERAVCRAFLRAVGVRFADTEIVAPCDEPADVSFRDARFQVRDELMGRRRGDEWKQREQRWNKARRIRDTRESVTWPTPMKKAELVDFVAEALEAKSKKYGCAGCATIDALVYADITSSRFLVRRSLAKDLRRLESQGWRSVSVLFPPYGIVLLARDAAPTFLRQLVGKTRKAWRKVDGLFDAQAASNPTPQADAREAPRLGRSSRPRAAGRER